MKRVVLLLMCSLLLVSTVQAFAQGWGPGPIGAPPPPVMVPGPMPGAEMGMQPIFPGCPPGPMGPMCKTPLGPGSVSVMVGWQPNNDPGQVKISTRNLPVFGQVGNQLTFNVNGVWLGGSGRLFVSPGIALRVEGRNLFPSTQTIQTLSQLAAAPVVARSFTGYYAWRLIDGSAALQLAPNFAVLGGVRYDFFDVRMTNPGDIPGFSTNADEGDYTTSNLLPYLGFEASWTDCNYGIQLRAIGTPLTATYTKYGLTNGDPTGTFAVRDRFDATSKFGTFYEATLNCARRLGNNVNVGGFVSLQGLTHHSEPELTGSSVIQPASTTQTVDVDFNRRTWIFGGTASLAFASPF